MCRRNFPWRRSLTHSIGDGDGAGTRVELVFALWDTPAQTLIQIFGLIKTDMMWDMCVRTISQISNFPLQRYPDTYKIKWEKLLAGFHSHTHTHKHMLSHRLWQPHSFMGGDREHKITCSQQSTVSQWKLLWTQIWIMVLHTNINIHTQRNTNSLEVHHCRDLCYNLFEADFP